MGVRFNRTQQQQHQQHQQQQQQHDSKCFCVNSVETQWLKPAAQLDVC